MNNLSASNFVRFYLEKLKENKIVYSECTACGRKFLPPVSHCSECGANNFEIKEATNSGVIETYTIIHIPSHKFEGKNPFPVAIIRLDDGVKLMAQIRTDDLSKLSVGKKVEARFDEEKEDTSRLYFVLTE